MTYDTFRLIFIACGAAAGVMLIVSIVLFIVLKIPEVIGDLSGRTAKKAIEDIREKNESSGTKTYKSSAVNKARGKTTDKISPSGRIMHRRTNELTGAMATAELKQSAAPQSPAAETDVLAAEAEETTILTPMSEETTILTPMSEETTILTPMSEETTILAEPAYSAETTVLSPPEDSAAFSVAFDITYIHTSEIIY